MRFRAIIIIVILLSVMVCTTSFAPYPPPQVAEKIEDIKYYEEEFLPEVPPMLVQTEGTLTDEQIICKIISKLQPKINEGDAEEIARLTIDLSNEYDLDPYWMLAIMYTESRFKNDVVSSEGARGLMQLIPSTAEFMGMPSEELHTPAINVDAGFKYYRYLLDRYDNQEMTTIAYNQGPGNVSRGTYRTWYHGRVKEAHEMILDKKQEIEEEF